MKYKAYLLSLFVFFALALSLKAETITTQRIDGRVLHDNKAVPFVVVYLDGTEFATTTCEAGSFSLEAHIVENAVLKVQGMGYKTYQKALSTEVPPQNLYIELEAEHYLLDQVVVSGSRIGLLRYLPGSAAVIDTRELQMTMPVNGNEALRNISGLHVVEEEGAGLRLNIGVRGLDPDKSRNVLVLEDGIPVALAPYGEPEMYFTPSIDRMSGVEVLKGNGTILFGPQTIGGVINYLTADAPEETEVYGTMRAGAGGFYNFTAGYGNTFDNTGVRVDFQRKQAENLGPTRFLFHDLNLKMQNRFSPESVLNVKAGIYDENSNSTYVGLTQSMYDAGEMDDFHLTPGDRLHIRRYALSGNHQYRFSDQLQLNSVAYAYTTSRNWNRQDFTYSPTASNLTGVHYGSDEDVQGSIFLRNSTGHRNRQFEVAGIEPRLSGRYALGSTHVKTDAGMRYLYERAFEQRVVGADAAYASGDLRDDEIRTGHAVSAYIQKNMILNAQWSFTMGLRNENIFYERDIMRLNYTDTSVVAHSRVFSIIPGGGVNYNVSETIGLFAGVHRGFAPPRTKDAISSDGDDMQLDAEKSWNTELGARIKQGSVQLEMTLFYMDFSNQVIPVSESSGGAGAGYINGGATLNRGAEASLVWDILPSFIPAWNIDLGLNATYVRSEFVSDRFVLHKKATNGQFEDVYTNVKGNRTPYAPELMMAGSFTFAHEKGFGLRLSGNYVSEQYTDVLNTEAVGQWVEMNRSDEHFDYVQATYNGRIGKLNSYFIANAGLWYDHSSGLGFNLSVKNIFNERYISSRRPQGIRVGMPRFVMGGVTYRL